MPSPSYVNGYAREAPVPDKDKLGERNALTDQTMRSRES